MSATNDDSYLRLPRTLHVAYRQHVTGSSNIRGEQFATLIREARAAAGISQDALAAETGINRTTIIRWESGDASRPDPDQVRRVCRALHVDPRRAALALGFLTADDLLPAGDDPVDPELEEVLRILQDPTVPKEDKDRWIDYLKFLQARARQQARDAG